MSETYHGTIMTSHRLSYWKTILMTGGIASGLVCLLVLSLHYLASPWGPLMAVAASLLGIPVLAVTIGGFLCLYRDSRQWVGKPDIFYKLTRSSPSLDDRPPRRPGRPFWRPLLGPALRPGDVVRVRTEAEIQRTLDRHGMLDDLPFMPEMLSYCGQTFRVHRRVDKINDMITKTGLRRLDNVVTLHALRCNGSAHGGCQAECQILWKEAWLQRVEASSAESETESNHSAGAATIMRPSSELSTFLHSNIAPIAPSTTAEVGNSDVRYQCQITQLLKASRPMKDWDFRQDLRALLWGNVALPAFLVALLTRLFNRAQGLRGGVDYPWCPEGQSAKTPREDLALQSGEWVRVKDREAIAMTLDRKSRNRGMWFDREMLRFCGQVFRVRRRIEKLIDERNGQMLHMKTPCITLEGVTATGEFLRFCPQHEYIFWREIWLERKQKD
jgi:hypothetical protein